MERSERKTAVRSLSTEQPQSEFLFHTPPYYIVLNNLLYSATGSFLNVTTVHGQMAENVDTPRYLPLRTEASRDATDVD